MKKREFDPIKGTFPDADKIRCRKCIYRDKTELKLDGKVIKVGVTKAFCDKYPAPPKSNGKPHEVLFLNTDCPYYKSEDE